jgi:type II secretory ATPase GspE/PulE/Tfp pilus assembly ATPase PilB-like protein
MNAAAHSLPSGAPPRRPIHLSLVDIEVPEHLQGDPDFDSVPRLALELELEPTDRPRTVRAPVTLPAEWVKAPSARPRGPVATPEELRAAIASQTHEITHTGEALVASGLLLKEDLDRALDVQREMKAPLGEIVVKMGFVTEAKLARVLADRLGVPVVDVNRFPVEDEARRRIPSAVCSKLNLLPLMVHEGALVVAMSDPFDGDLVQSARFAAGCRVIPVLATGDAMVERLDHHMDLDTVQSLTAEMTPDMAPLEPEFDVEQVSVSDSVLVRLVNRMITDAAAMGASDIHVEPGAGQKPTRVRMRRDGVMTEYAELPVAFRSAIISRLKIMAGLDISERRRPQDGRIDFARHGGLKLELRVTTVPTALNLENVVLRLLAAAKPIPLDELGMERRVLERLKSLTARPHGLILVCGPTGSGKTTTLHSLISHINTPDRKIWTAEDPIEITQEGLSQVQVNPRVGWTFAAALRSLLRADPDVIMVGEMRDAETAQTAVDASLTGHLVMSTLHTNSAVETVGRLLDLGVDPAQFSDSLLGVLGQRLVRRVCPSCKRVKEVNEDQLMALAHGYVQGGPENPEEVMLRWLERDQPLVLAHGAGCDACGGTGFRGRIGLYEFLDVTPRMRASIQHRSTDALRDMALGQGMRTLLQDGIEKALAGLTTLEQVRSAT